MPLIFNCIPSSTPAGIWIGTTTSSRIRPCSSLPGARLVTDRPIPPHAGQVVTVCIWPRKVFWTRRTWPLPPHVEQVPYSLPFARTNLVTLIFFSAPLATSSKLILSRTRKLLPFTVRPPRCCPKPPKPPPPNPPPKMSPNWEKMSSMFMPPPWKPPPPKPPGALCPNRSNLARLSGSLRISYAPAPSLNFSSAAWSPGFLSGWNLIASLR